MAATNAARKNEFVDYVNSKGIDQSAHPQSAIVTFGVRIQHVLRNRETQEKDYS